MKLIILLSVLFTISTSLELSKNSLVDILLGNKIPENFKPPKDFKINPAITQSVIQQRVNHFDAQNIDTFEQHFFINDEFFQSGGPTFVYLHMSPYDDGLNILYLNYGPAFDLAQEFNGRLVIPQHRYFENSHVTPDLSVENMRFLSVDQAIEDLAHLVSHLRSENNSSVILVGWDYGGSLATWFAQKYPHLVTGIWVSNAKLSPDIGHNEPINYLENMVRIGGDDCFQRVQNAFRQFEDMIANNQSNVLRRRYNFCFPIPYTAGEFDTMYFYQIMMTYFYQFAQFFDEYIAREVACAELVNAPVEHDWEALGHVFGLFEVPFPLCYPNSFEHQIEIIRENQALDSEFGYAWAFYYLECASFGFFLNSGEGNSIFGSGFAREFFAHTCNVLFGFTEDQLNQNYALFNTRHGGRTPLVRNAYFTNGELYPWIHQTIHPDAIHSTSFYETIPMRALHAEMSIFFDDPIFAEVKRRVFTAVRGWLGIEN